MDIEITLTGLTYGGEALGRIPDPQTGSAGRAVFVPLALPGERVRARVVEDRRGFVRAELLEVLDPAAERIAPRCRHFGACGGCHYQHMPYESQLAAKTEILSDQLRRIGKIADPPVHPAIPSATPWNYRNHLQFHATEDGRLGFVDARAASVLPIQECHLPVEAIDAVWPNLALDARGALERISFRSGDDDLMLVFESGDAQPPELEIEAGISVVHLHDADAVVLAGEDHLLITVEVNHPGIGPQRRSFRVSAGSFFQVNTPMAGRMVEHLLARLPLERQVTLADVYCGVGLFSAFLAPHVGQLIGIESSPAACEDFGVNLDEFDNVRLYEAAAEDVLASLDVRPGLMVVDPPRAGLDRRALDAILNLKPAMLAYVSCDPSTLARDAARLIAGGYRLSEVTPFDLFPQTYHIESISIFRS